MSAKTAFVAPSVFSTSQSAWTKDSIRSTTTLNRPLTFSAPTPRKQYSHSITIVSEYNYNIYQTGKERSKRQVEANDRVYYLKKPLGLVLEEGQDGMVFIADKQPFGSAARDDSIKVGDVVVAVSATFGDDIWSTKGVGLDRVLKTIKLRAGDLITFILQSPDEIAQEKQNVTNLANARREEAREKFGEREVLDPVSWRSSKQDISKMDEELMLQEQLRREELEANRPRISVPEGGVKKEGNVDWLLWGSGLGTIAVIILILLLNK